MKFQDQWSNGSVVGGETMRMFWEAWGLELEWSTSHLIGLSPWGVCLWGFMVSAWPNDS